MQGDILKALIDKLERKGTLSRDEFLVVYEGRNEIDRQWLSRKAFALRCSAYGNDVYLRALIECSSYCRSGCFYCGINRTNCHAERYRLSPEEVFEAAAAAYDSGFRTFVLQGGEDPVFVKDLGKMVAELRRKYPDAAITLSFGEWPEEMYAEWKAAGADRYLLRHESAAPEHFAHLHPESQRLESRMECLRILRKLGYQVGAGFMVGSPFQSSENVAEDLVFLTSFRPEMIGIGPFIPHRDTVFASYSAGSVDDTLFLLSVLRIAMPHVLLPATTALASLSDTGMRDGLLAGANVIMPNMSPSRTNGLYQLYDGKKRQSIGASLEKEISAASCRPAMVRGDYTDGEGGSLTQKERTCTIRNQ